MIKLSFQVEFLVIYSFSFLWILNICSSKDGPRFSPHFTLCWTQCVMDWIQHMKKQQQKLSNVIFFRNWIPVMICYPLQGCLGKHVLNIANKTSSFFLVTFKEGQLFYKTDLQSSESHYLSPTGYYFWVLCVRTF